MPWRSSLEWLRPGVLCSCTWTLAEQFLATLMVDSGASGDAEYEPVEDVHL